MHSLRLQVPEPSVWLCQQSETVKAYESINVHIVVVGVDNTGSWRQLPDNRQLFVEYLHHVPYNCLDHPLSKHQLLSENLLNHNVIHKENSSRRNLQYQYFIRQSIHRKTMQDDETHEGNFTKKLNPSKIKNMLKLEELFHNKYLNVELLHELISLYTSAIQSTDEHQSELRFYFLEKIQFVLSRQETLTLLQAANGNSVADTLRETLRVTSRLHVDESPLMKKKKKVLQNYDGENPDEKKKQIDMRFEIMEQTKKDMDQLNMQVKVACEKSRLEKKKVAEITQNQNDQLEARRANRRKPKPRKKSLQVSKDGEDDVKVIQKSDLLKAQEQINDAVLKMTIRMTQKMLQNQLSGLIGFQEVRQPTKGRVKISKDFDDPE